MLHVITAGARRMIADLELMLGFRLCMRCVWWFTWVFIIPALLTVSTQDLQITGKYKLRTSNSKMCCHFLRGAGSLAQCHGATH